MYLLGTNALSDLMMDHALLKPRVDTCPQPVLTSVIARGEVRDGLIRMPTGSRRARLELNAAIAFTRFHCEPVSVAVAERYGILKSDLRRAGQIIGENDLWIAATALSLGATVVTRDADFRRVPGLTVEDWTV